MERGSMGDLAPDSSGPTASWAAPRLVALSAAGSAEVGKVEGLTELQKTGTTGVTIKYGYGPS